VRLELDKKIQFDEMKGPSSRPASPLAMRSDDSFAELDNEKFDCFSEMSDVKNELSEEEEEEDINAFPTQFGETNIKKILEEEKPDGLKFTRDVITPCAKQREADAMEQIEFKGNLDLENRIESFLEVGMTDPFHNLDSYYEAFG